MSRFFGHEQVFFVRPLVHKYFLWIIDIPRQFLENSVDYFRMSVKARYAPFDLCDNEFRDVHSIIADASRYFRTNNDCGFWNARKYT